MVRATRERLQMAYPVGAEDFALQIERLEQENLDAVIHWGDAAEVARRVLAAEPQAVVLVADARDTARLLVDLRAAGYRGAVFGGPAMGRGRFLREAGAAAEGAVFPRLGDSRLDASEFAKTFRSRCGREPDYLAAASYDAARLMIDAVRKAGLNRARIRDAIADVSPWQGAGGTVAWDNSGGNARDVSLGTVQNGRITAADEEHSRQERPLDRGDLSALRASMFLQTPATPRSPNE